MHINRDRYLKMLKDFAWDGQVKVITGIRRCGKSYLLNNIYRQYLEESGVNPQNIISVALDLTKNVKYRNPLELAEFARNAVEGKKDNYYLFIDEIQMSDDVPNPYNPDGKRITFYDALNDLRSIPNLDVYVTGSNSKMLSSDILTEFRGRSDEIRVHPLSFAEYYSAVGGDKAEAFDRYMYFGGMPLVISRPDDTARMNYLKSLYSEVYFKDIIERKKITRPDVLEATMDLLCSSVGSLTNPTNIANSVNAAQKYQDKVAPNTVRSYMEFLDDAFLFHECKRYDIKGKSYFDYPNKYYCEDIGLRNARIGFRQQETTHIMENIIYNELIIRGFSVDVGVVYSTEKGKRIAREIDFIATAGSKKYYIQSAYAMESSEKIASEIKPFNLAGNSFPKIIVRRDMRKGWYDDNGYLNIGIENFLLEEW